MALQQRKPEAVIHHSDQGSQYASIAFGERCKKMGVRPSMGKPGRRLGQSDARELLRQLGVRVDRPQELADEDRTTAGAVTWIEGWYNPRRRHSALNYLSPMNFESKQLNSSPPLRRTRVEAVNSTLRPLMFTVLLLQIDQKRPSRP